jgi:hypothetical protein
MCSNTVLTLRRHDHPGRILDLEPRSEHQLHQPLGGVYVLRGSLSTPCICLSHPSADGNRQLVLDCYDEYPSPASIFHSLLRLSIQPPPGAFKRCARNDSERLRLLYGGRGERYVYLPGVDLQHPRVLVQLLELEPDHSVPVARSGDFRLHPREQHYRRSPTEAQQRSDWFCAVWVCKVVHHRCQGRLRDGIDQKRDHKCTVPCAEP